MRYLFLLLMLTMAISFKGVGQDMNAADKSKYFKAVKNAMDDSTKMMALMGLGYNVYSGNKPDSALYYYTLAYKIAAKLCKYFMGVVIIYVFQVLKLRGE